jgi:hypothetical protein
VDDQFAIAWALRSPERLAVEAVYAAPYCSKAIQKIFPITDERLKTIVHYAGNLAGGMEKSYNEIQPFLAFWVLRRRHYRTPANEDTREQAPEYGPRLPIKIALKGVLQVDAVEGAFVRFFTQKL